MAMDGYSLSDIQAVTGGMNGFGSGSWFWIIVLFLFGFGNGGMFGRGEHVATQGELQRSFDTNTIVNKLNGLENGICDGFYAQNTTMLNGFNGVERAIDQARFDSQNCCCNTQRAIDAVKYENAQNACDIIKAIHDEGEATRSLITENTIQSLRDQLQTANGVIAQSTQTQYILSQLGRFVTNPPCNPYAQCGCGYGCTVA